MAIKGISSYEAFLSKLSSCSKQFNHIKEIDTYCVNMIRAGGDNVSIPSIGVVADFTPNYKADMINLYNGTFGLFDEVNVIPEDIKINQAAVLDGLCYGYDIATDSATLYSMNMFLFDLELDEKLLKSIMEANKIGQIKAFRVDIEYSSTNVENFEWSLVKHKKVIDDENIVLVPYTIGHKLTSMIKNYLNAGLVLKTKQLINDTEKVRCITEKTAVLQKYCDSEEAVIGLKSVYYPLSAYFYAPVVGAPSTTAMMTKIELFKLAELKMLSGLREVVALGVQKPKDPVIVESEEYIITRHILKLQEMDNSQYEQFIDKLPYTDKFASFADRSISETVISSYLHSIRDADRKKILSRIPDSKELVDSRVNLFKSCRVATDDEMKDLQQLFKTHMCKLLLRKKDGQFSSVTCTNNKDKLAAVYGKNYFRNYESFGVKVNFILWGIEKYGLDNIKALDSLLIESGLDSVDAANIIDKAKSFGGELSTHSIKNALYEVYEQEQRAPRETNTLLVRTLTARITNTDKVIDYYRSIDPNNIVRVLIYE